MGEKNLRSFNNALEDFHRARRRATLKQIMARLTGRSASLLSYDEVRTALRASRQIERGLREIPLNEIVGSVGRYNDFTRDFLPRKDSMASRWATVKAAATDTAGWPPIDVYELGGVYFVLDGNHRVSAARQMGMTKIQAYVTEVQTNVPLTADVQPDELICKAQYAEFLERSALDELRPGADLTVTAPGAYRLLDEHIAVHRHILGIENQKAITWTEAAASWYDHVYKPVVQMIRDKGLLQDFPGRTKTDLYLWLAEHQAKLEEELGRPITSESAAVDLATQHSSQPERVRERVSEKIKDALLPDGIESGPKPGTWRKQHLIGRQNDRLFMDILVPVSVEEDDWYGLDQALIIAQREGSQLNGLYVPDPQDDKLADDRLLLAARFEERCRASGVKGQLIVETGSTSRIICTRARWNDLLVLTRNQPPREKGLARLGSGFRQIIQRCARPVFAVPPKSTSPLQRPLLAYDGSPKAEEALFLATYLSGHWQIPLTVVIAAKGKQEEGLSQWVGQYLERHHLAADFVVDHAPPAQLILSAAADKACDFLIMGGYGAQPVVEIVLGSTVREILINCNEPVLICQ